MLSRYFRRVLLAALEDAFESEQLRFAGALQPLSDPRCFAEHLRPTRETGWVVYAKRPFAGPEQVLDYLGRYTHRIAISNRRLCSLDNDSVCFRYTDYRRAGRLQPEPHHQQTADTCGPARRHRQPYDCSAGGRTASLP